MKVMHDMGRLPPHKCQYLLQAGLGVGFQKQQRRHTARWEGLEPSVMLQNIMEHTYNVTGFPVHARDASGSRCCFLLTKLCSFSKLHASCSYIDAKISFCCMLGLLRITQ